jgi:drug/metabolite transporter (DMT)-like permease
MIPLLVEKFGLERVSYCLGIFAQCVYPLAFLYANDKKINPVETSLIRGILLMVINFAIIRYYDMGVDFKYDVTWWNLFKRNGIVVIHGLAITAAQFFLPLPIVHTINFFAPIFIFIIDYFENGVRINRAQFTSLMVGVLGIITTLNDELVAKLMDPEYEMKTDFKNYISLDPT